MTDARHLNLVKVVWAWGGCCHIVKRWWEPMRKIPLSPPGDRYRYESSTAWPPRYGRVT